jgi:hypothetical protein
MLKQIPKLLLLLALLTGRTRQRPGFRPWSYVAGRL